MRMGSTTVIGVALALVACGTPESGLPHATLLTPEGTNQPSSAVSPDGNRIAYWASGPTEWQLRVANIDLTQSRVVLTTKSPNDPILWSPDGKSLAITADMVGVGDVWMVPADSGTPVRLTTAPGLESPLLWHPRGDQLAFLGYESGGTIRSNVVTIATGATRPMLAEQRSTIGIWSPDGSRIAYQVNEGSRSTLWLADSLGGNARQLTTEGLEYFNGFGSPWSPDGKELLYVSRRTGTGDIWAFPVDGGQPRQLTRDVRDDRAPVWSSDGKWIAFISERGKQTDIWVMPSTGGEALRVTDDPLVEDQVQWVGASMRLTYETGQVARTLVQIDAANGTEHQITPDSVRINAFDIAPDGRTLVAAAGLGGGVSEVRVFSLSNGASRTLVPGPNGNGDPYYSPDGKWILFSSDRSGSQDAWIIDTAGGTPRALTTWPTDEVDAEWSADSKWVYFLSGRTGGALSDIYRVPVGGGEPEQITKTGNINNIEPSRGGDAIYASTLGMKAGRFALEQMMPDGTAKTLWDRSNSNGLSHRRISPSGDSLAVSLEQPDGKMRGAILSARTGAVSLILNPDETPGPWSPDGSMLLYYLGSPTSDLGILNLKDGTTRRLTTTPGNEGSAVWAPDSKSVVVLRAEPRRRIALVDVSKLVAGAKKQ